MRVVLQGIGLAWAAVALFGTVAKADWLGDVYVLAYSWTPEFCYDQVTYPGCSAPKDFWGKYFTMHGLWPQYSTGGYPQSCTTEAFNSSVAYEVGWDTMTTYWPNVQAAETDPLYTSFWEHEWSKHGTCTGLSQYDYFQDTINLIKKFGTPASVTNAVGGAPISAQNLRADFGGPTMAALQCSGGSYVVGVFTCWSRDAAGHPLVQITCPADVQAEDTCTTSDVTVCGF